LSCQFAVNLGHASLIAIYRSHNCLYGRSMWPPGNRCHFGSAGGEVSLNKCKPSTERHLWQGGMCTMTINTASGITKRLLHFA